MKRPLLIATLTSLSIVVALAACGKADVVCDLGYYLDTPQLCANVSSLGFGLEFRTGTLIGTKPVNTIDVRNGGTADLVVSEVNKGGTGSDPNFFTVDVSYDLPDGGSSSQLPATIPGGKHFFMRVIFAPTQAKLYNASVTVKSNAGPEAIQHALDIAQQAGFPAVVSANQGQPAGSFVFLLSGCGVPADGGSSPCYRDGGT